MEFRHESSRSRGFSSALLALLALTGLGACQADAVGSSADPLSDAGLRRDAEPGQEADTEVPEPADDGGAPPDPDAARPPEPDAAAAPEADAGEGPELDARVAPPADAAAPPPVPDAGPPPGTIALVLRVSNDVPESVYVQSEDGSGQPGWIGLTHEDRPYFLAPLCDPDVCLETPETACHPGQDLVLDVTGGRAAGSVTYTWDGIVSHRPAGESCQVRGPAPEGAWKATFCWSLSAEFTDATDAAADAPRPGHVGQSFCQDVPFELPRDREVIAVLSGG